MICAVTSGANAGSSTTGVAGLAVNVQLCPLLPPVVPGQPALPIQPANSEPAAGAAVAVTCVDAANVSLQSPLRALPFQTQLTTVVPVKFVTLTVPLPVP